MAVPVAGAVVAPQSRGAIPGRVLFGGSGADVMAMGSGTDIYVAGSFGAAVQAGSGVDVFAFFQGIAGGSTTVNGFNAQKDSIALQGYGAAPQQTVSAGTTTLTLSDGTNVVLVGVTGISASFV